jgi:tetratricopeptide (TPR) repeat protein
MILLAGALVLLALAGCRSAHTTSAILYLEQRQYEKAIAVIEEGFEYRDDEPDAFYYMAEAYSRLGDQAVEDNDFYGAKQNYERAYQNYMRAVQLDSAGFFEDVQAALDATYTTRLRRGVEDFNGSFYEQAEGHFRLAYAALPDSITPIKNIAQMKMKHATEVEDPVPLYNEALELIDQVLAVNPSAFSLQANKADVLVKLGRISEADALYDTLLEEHGDDPYLLIDIVNLSVSQEKYERAANLTMRVIDIYQNDDISENDGKETIVLLVNAANWLALEDIRRYDEALELLDQALDLELNPSKDTLFRRLQTHYDYGIWLEEQAEADTDPVKNQEARSQFERGVDVGNALVAQFPDYCNGYLILAQCQFKVGEDQAANLNVTNWQDCGTGSTDSSSSGDTDSIQ